MQQKASIFFFLCFAFLLTLNARAESESYKKAQNFFFQSKQATEKYLKSGKGLGRADTQVASREFTSYNDPSSDNSSGSNQKITGDVTEQPTSYSTKALYFSLMTQTVNSNDTATPNYNLSVAISIPVYSTFSYLNSEFQFAGTVKDAGDWGQIQFIQKEAFRVARFTETQIEFFLGMGLGYGHGSLFSSNQRFFAPWATGLQWGKMHRADKVFYRFELGWTGDFYFLDNNYRQGLLANLSLGYKL